MIPGEYFLAEEPIELNAGRVVRTISVANTGDRPVQVGSHYHFFEVNRALLFDRAAAIGYRLAIASGTSVRFEPGEQRPVSLVELAGARQVWGFNGLISGPLDGAGVADGALERALAAGFAHRREMEDRL